MNAMNCISNKLQMVTKSASTYDEMRKNQMKLTGISKPAQTILEQSVVLCECTMMFISLYVLMFDHTYNLL